MTHGRLLWITGGVIVASILDLAYMFWSRSATGTRFGKAAWNAGGLGRGRFNVMNVAKNLSHKSYHQ